MRLRLVGAWVSQVRETDKIWGNLDSKDPSVCNPARPLQESPGPCGPGIPKESSKSLPGPSGPGVQKVSETVSKQSRKSLKIDCFETLETVSRLFRTFFGSRGRKAPGDSLETLSGFRARKARETPVRGGRGCNLRC